MRVSIWLAAAAASLAVGCTPTPLSTAANLKGSHDVALVGDLLFVTSSERSELRALDLTLPARPNWVAAPNPLEALSIPVIDRPVGLARDVHYEDLISPDGSFPTVTNGKAVGGPYVYAMSGGLASISIVAADPARLVEVGRLSTQGSVTAIAARGVPGGASTLYYTTLDAGAARLYQVQLPPLGPTERFSDADLAARPVYLTSLMPNEVGVSLVVLPGTRIALATRGQAGQAGRTLLIDATSPLTPTPLNFPRPVRALFTAPASGVVGAGTRVFGMYDEEVCGASGGCSGLVAVDVATGEVANDATGYPMIPLTFDGALPMGLAFAPQQPISTGAVVSLLGVATVSTGEIVLFDAGALRHIDADTNPPSNTPFGYQNAAGQALAIDPGTGPDTGSVVLADGATQDQTVTVEFEALIPGLTDLPTSDADGAAFPASSAALAGAAVGDTIEIATPAGACPETATVTAITATALETAGAPAACSGRTSFSVRATGPKPYGVTGTYSGFMGRTGPGDAFAFVGPYYFHPDGYNPATPMLAFKFGAADPGVVRGNRYALQTSTNFAPLVGSVASDPVNQPCTSILPGGVTYATPSPVVNGTPTPRFRAYIAYPSADAVLDLDLASFTRTSVQNAACYR